MQKFTCKNYTWFSYQILGGFFSAVLSSIWNECAFSSDHILKEESCRTI